MSFPVVPLDSIPTQGLTVDVGDWARVGCGEGLAGDAPSVAGRLVVTRSGRHISVGGALEGAATVRCDRCGDPVRVSASGDIDCVYVPVDDLSRRDEEEPDEDAADQGEYDGVALDLAHVVREFFALERPVRVRCADVDAATDEACLARFRARANLGPSEPDPRLAALTGFKPNQ